ncbi:unnamed protein product [Rotaria sp. Silwood1]|nr:unnamed protein product [Rotaria sp. Silwood1]
MTENRYSVDYAKLGTSACKKCKAKIAKGEIRIAKLTPSPFSEGDMMKIYHHVQCMFDTFLHARATTKIIESSTDLDGWLNIIPKPTVVTPIKKVLPPTTSASSANEDDDDNEITIDNDDIKVIDKKKSVAIKEDTIDRSTTATTGVHIPINDDPKHPDNSFRQFRGLCTKIAETNGHLAKTSIVEQFITYGSDGESYKGKIQFFSMYLLYCNREIEDRKNNF